MIKKNLFLALTLLISLISVFDLFNPGLPITHDGQDHVARIANFYQNLSEGNIIPRWAGNLNWGYGHPILEFLYPLPSYFASLFHFFGFTLVDSVKLVFSIAFILSSITMYIFIKELLNDEKTAFLASLLYVIAPYRFVDLYVRGAIGEHVAFIFPPLVLFFLLKLSKRHSLWYLIGGAFSLAGLNLSHNAVSLMFIPLLALYALFVLLQSKKKVQLGSQYLIIAFLGFGLSAFFWIPAFVEGKYTLRDIVTGSGEYAESFVMWKDFFIGVWSYGGTLLLSKQVGTVHWIGVFMSIIATYILYKNKNRLWMIGLGSFLIFLISLFLMTHASSPIWRSLSVLQKFQFPWRLLSLTVFLSALLGAVSFYILKDRYKNFFLLIVIAILLLVNKDYWHANGFVNKEEIFYKGVYEGTTDTGESAPVWSVRFMGKRPESKAEIIEGKANIREIKRSFTKREYEVVAYEKSRILENTLYFPGWITKVDDAIVQPEFQDPRYRGLITFYVEKGKHMVNLVYKETRLRFYSNIVSLISLILILIFPAFQLIRKKI